MTLKKIFRVSLLIILTNLEVSMYLKKFNQLKKQLEMPKEVMKRARLIKRTVNQLKIIISQW